MKEYVYKLKNGKVVSAYADEKGNISITKESLEIMVNSWNDGYEKGRADGRADAVDEFANWLVEQGILGNRCISDGEITDYGKVYAKKYKEQLKEKE